MLIQDRIKLIMKSGNLSASDFAEKIDVKRSNLSHILSGRNKPSLDFLAKVIESYPKVNASWLITGETREEIPMEAPEKRKALLEEEDAPAYHVNTKPTTVKSSSDKAIKSILLIYEDGTFDRLEPNAQ